jgi:hypothetical protein
MKELNRSWQNINAEEIIALHEELQRNPQITSLDLSHTGIPRDVLLSLVVDFRHLRHLGIDGDRSGIEEELRFNRALHINAPAAVPLMELPEFYGSNLSQAAATGQFSTGFAERIANQNAQAAAVMELPVIAEELGLNRASNINPPAASAAAGQGSTGFAEIIANQNAQAAAAAAEEAAAPVQGQQPVGPHAQRIVEERIAVESPCCRIC